MFDLLPDDHPELKVASTRLVTPDDLRGEPSVKHLINDLFLTMDAHHGLGLAAPQVGIKWRIFVYRYGGRPYVVINPQILDRSKETTIHVEGCLSFPGKRVKVERHNRIRVQYSILDMRIAPDHRGGKRQFISPILLTRLHWMDGVPAHVFQHELDHLDGITMLDRATD